MSQPKTHFISFLFSTEDAVFQCYYGGNFVVENGIKVSYVGGGILSLESKPQVVLTNLMESLNESIWQQRIWYKLPYEEYSELKQLCNGDQNFQRMCLAAVWTKAVDIFLEKEENGDAGDGSHVDRVVGDGSHVDRAVGDGSIGDGAAGDGAVGDGSECDRVFIDMEARVEQNLAGFVDEEEHDNDESTPLNSDCEEGERRYVRCKKGSGDIRIEQVFDSIAEFKEAVIDYALKKGVNIKFTRWGSEKSEVRCSIGGNCKFRIYCAYDEKIGVYMVKTFIDEHACTKDGFCKVLKSRIIVDMFLNDIRQDPTFKVKAMQKAIEERYSLIASSDQCRKARGKALKMIQDEYDEQFARIHDYKEQLLE